MKTFDPIPTDRALATTARQLILDNLSQFHSVSELAYACGTSPYTLKRVFKKVYGISVARFNLEVRIERAKELLQHTNNTLQMIADELGYTEGNNFLNTFKRETGFTPGAWRKKYQQI